MFNTLKARVGYRPSPAQSVHSLHPTTHRPCWSRSVPPSEDHEAFRGAPALPRRKRLAVHPRQNDGIMARDCKAGIGGDENSAGDITVSANRSGRTECVCQGHDLRRSRAPTHEGSAALARVLRSRFIHPAFRQCSHRPKAQYPHRAKICTIRIFRISTRLD